MDKANLKRLFMIYRSNKDNENGISQYHIVDSNSDEDLFLKGSDYVIVNDDGNLDITDSGKELLAYYYRVILR